MVVEQNKPANFVTSASRQALAQELALEVKQVIANAIDEKGFAYIAFSGGSTPKPLFNELANQDIDWQRVLVTLVDERCVDENHELSNTRFLKLNLFDQLNQSPRYVPLFSSAAARTAGEADSLIEHTLKIEQSLIAEMTSAADVPSSFDLAVLGMGTDGHTASFFPDADNIAELIDAEDSAALKTSESPSSQVPRITWSLSRLLQSRKLVLHINGSDKLAILNQAQEQLNALQYPIASVLAANKSLTIFYSE